MKNLIAILFLFFVPALCAQGQDPDSLFSRARSLAENKKYTEAAEILENLCRNYPGNRDYPAYVSRIYFWSGTPEKAKARLLESQSPEAMSKEELELLIGIELALKDWSSVLAHTDLGTTRFPESKTHYSYQKALALEALNRDREALKLLEQIPENAPDYPAADYLRTIILKKQKNTLSAGYFITAFDRKAFTPQQIAFIEYGRKLKASTHLFRVNYANMFGKNAFQFETDAYIPVKTRNYIYANLGVSEKNSIFPQVRAGLEFYREHKHISASLGARYLYFGKTNDPLLVTAHVAYLSSNGWSVNYRPFISFLDQHKTLASHLLYLRKSFANRESYVQLDLQYGNLPYFYLTSDVLNRLRAYRAGINTRFRIERNWFLQPVFMYEYEEYAPKTYRNRYTFQLILSRRF